MIRRICFSIIALVLGLAGAYAQGTGVRYGAQLSYDVSFPSGKNPYKAGSGFTLGGVANISFPGKFFIEPGLKFTYASMPTKDLVSFNEKYMYEGAANLYTLHIPVSFGYTFYNTGFVSVEMSTGPYLNVNLAARQKLDPDFGVPAADREPSCRINLFDYGWKRVDSGWSIRLSTTFAGSYFIGIDGDVAFTPLAKFGNGDNKVQIRRSSVSVVLGYYF